MAFYDLMALFQPGLKHTVEEQERKRNEVVLPGDAAGGWDVDLEAGTATLAPTPGDDEASTSGGAGRQPHQDAPEPR